MTPASKPHSKPDGATTEKAVAYWQTGGVERARALLAFEGEPKVVGQWFAEARAMARDYLGLFEQLQTARDAERLADSRYFDAVKQGDVWHDAWKQAEAERDGLLEQFDTLLQAALALDDQFVAGESVDPDSPEALAFHRAVSFPAIIPNAAPAPAGGSDGTAGAAPSPATSSERVDAVVGVSPNAPCLTDQARSEDSSPASERHDG